MAAAASSSSSDSTSSSSSHSSSSSASYSSSSSLDSDSKSLSLKLLIDTKSKRVLYAEADKKAVDFLFHVLTLSMATVFGLLNDQQMEGSLVNLYRSVQNLSETYINHPKQTKEALLKPRNGGATTFASPLLSGPDHGHDELVAYRCQNGYNNDTGRKCFHYFSDNPAARCPCCGGLMNCKITYVAAASAPPMSGDETVDEGGFVKGVATYMVMDDLTVQPLSTVSSVFVLNKFKVKDVGALQIRLVNLGSKQALELIKTSMASKTVLTTVFLKKIL